MIAMDTFRNKKPPSSPPYVDQRVTKSDTAYFGFLFFIPLSPFDNILSLIHGFATHFVYW